MTEHTVHSELRFTDPDDVFESVRSLGDGLNDSAAHAALAALALLLANHIGDDKVVIEAVAQVKQAFRDYPEAAIVGTQDPDRKTFQVGGALDSLRKIIEIKPVPTIPGALTS